MTEITVGSVMQDRNSEYAIGTIKLEGGTSLTWVYNECYDSFFPRIIRFYDPNAPSINSHDALGRCVSLRERSDFNAIKRAIYEEIDRRWEQERPQQ
jgi:hypothetical protein